MAVLGSILVSEYALARVIDKVSAEDFYKPAHKIIFKAILALGDKGEATDPVTVEAELRRMGEVDRVGGIAALISLGDHVPTAANVEHYAGIVREKSMVRALLRTGQDIVESAFTDAEPAKEQLDAAQRQVFAIAAQTEKREVKHVKELVKVAFAGIEKRFEQRSEVTGVASGLKDLDKMTAGFQPTDLIILAARPGMGKTTLALNIAQNAAIRNRLPVLLFSLEMSNEQLVTRMLCSEARVDSTRLRSGMIAPQDWRHLTRAAGDVAEAPVYLDDSGMMTAMEVRAKARRWKSDRTIFPDQSGLGLIMIDYLQLMKGRADADSREREISEISGALKSLAKELTCPVIALSQLNRSLERREDKRPQLSDLRESGAIEQDADLIMFIYRDDKYNKESQDKGIAEVIIGKQRNGPTGTARVKFLDEYTRFENLAHEEG
jgi:replicative DNA helicase